jgi:hypothetical protein
VNGQTKSLDYVIRNGDRVSHAKHRHEIPVLADPIRIVHEDQGLFLSYNVFYNFFSKLFLSDYLVVDKPCSIPMVNTI